MRTSIPRTHRGTASRSRSTLGITGVMSIIIGMLFTFAVTTASANPLPGAIYTTDVNGQAVNANIYAAKADVYLNGGPETNGSGLPDGSYYVQVTTPSGDVLGTSVGSSNPTPVHVTNGVFDQLYQLQAILIRASNHTAGYDDTTNPGDEYKVWVSQVSTFDQNSSKTDNFKVRAEAASTTTTSTSTTSTTQATTTTTQATTTTTTALTSPTVQPLVTTTTAAPSTTTTTTGAEVLALTEEATTTTHPAPVLALTGTETHRPLVLGLGLILLGALLVAFSMRPVPEKQ